MARRPLLRVPSSGGGRIARARRLARTAAATVADVLHPLLTVARGLRLLSAAAHRKWAATPKDRRGPMVFGAACCLMFVAFTPYGPTLGLISLMAVAGWQGRERAPERTGPEEAETKRLRSLYEALVPYVAVPDDPNPLFSHGGDWTAAFSDYAFDAEGRPTRLRMTYPAYFPDSDPDERGRVEQLLYAKCGRGREYLFTWDEEAGELEMTVLPALSTAPAAQPFVTAPQEIVLGFGDVGAGRRTVPVLVDGAAQDLTPVLWRTGGRSTEPHLLAAGRPGSGTTSLLRSIALQAVRHGDVLVVDGGGSGEYACLTGRRGVLAVECGPEGALAGLEWAANETERRLITAGRARQAGLPAPEDTRRPLWILLDRPAVLGQAAAAEGRPDPQELLQVPLRHGRSARVTVAVAEHLDALDALHETVRAHTRARVVLGQAPPVRMAEVLGAPPHTTPPYEMPPGRGYARLGAGPVLRLQVPATVDPYDDEAAEARRRAVLDLLPDRRPGFDGPAADAGQERVPEQETDRATGSAPVA
ncbi:hypothetical protein ACWCXE_10740 [Streptomyces sp. NPDC001780]